MTNEPVRDRVLATIKSMEESIRVVQAQLAKLIRELEDGRDNGESGCGTRSGNGSQ